MNRVEFFVQGAAKTAGSKRAGVVTRKEGGKRVPVQHADGRYKTFVSDSSGVPGKNWRTDIRAAASEAMGDHLPFDVPVVLGLMIYFERPQGHHVASDRTRPVKESAPPFPTGRNHGDCSKLARSLEDAMTGIVFRDDSLVVGLLVRKRYIGGTEAQERPGAFVECAPSGRP